MQIEIFCLCESAPVNPLNQPSLINVFDTKIALGEPALIEPFLVALSLRFYREESGQHRFSVFCKDASGKTMMTPQTDIVALSIPTQSVTFFHTYQVPAWTVRAGVYRFSIEVDGKKLAETPLYVILGKP